MAPSSRTPRVLLVEDEARIAGFIAAGLGRYYDVVVAEDGDVGLFLATAEPFDAVILDLGLPRLPGTEVLEGLRKACPDLPVIVLTGRDDPHVRAACLAAGALAVITKPFSFEELKETVGAQLASD